MAITIYVRETKVQAIITWIPQTQIYHPYLDILQQV
jgi:hypothetical protein